MRAVRRSLRSVGSLIRRMGTEWAVLLAGWITPQSQFPAGARHRLHLIPNVPLLNDS